MARISERALLANSIDANRQSFLRHLRAENLSQNTIASYGESVRQFAEFVRREGMPQAMPHIRREHVETWIERLLQRARPATAHNRYRGLRSFFNWAVEEGEIKESPMARMKPPKLPETLIPILTQEQIERLVRSCSGVDFESRRDMAILQVFLSTGCRKSEVANLRWDERNPEHSDIDLEAGRARIRGKGGRDRLVDLTPKTVRALDRYLRARRLHFAATEGWLWLGKGGRLKPNGLARALAKRAEAVGIPKLHPHMLRHTYAHYWMLDGGGDDALMRNLGWRSRDMLNRYAASAGAERALERNRHHGLGARF